MGGTDPPGVSPLSIPLQLGKKVEKISTVFDFEGLSLRHLWKPGVELVQEVREPYPGGWLSPRLGLCPSLAGVGCVWGGSLTPPTGLRLLFFLFQIFTYLFILAVRSLWSTDFSLVEACGILVP